MALGTLLTVLDLHERKGNFPHGNLSNQFRRRQVGEIVSADVIDRDDGLTTILSHQKQCRVYAGLPPPVWSLASRPTGSTFRHGRAGGGRAKGLVRPNKRSGVEPVEGYRQYSAATEFVC